MNSCIQFSKFIISLLLHFNIVVNKNEPLCTSPWDTSVYEKPHGVSESTAGGKGAQVRGDAPCVSGFLLRPFPHHSCK